MIINDFEPTNPPPGALRRRMRPGQKPNFWAIGFGVLCVAGVFGMLGLLYSMG